jgi:LPS O-antigen subunit length determinant protein (WzzB/FepE family)
MADGDDLNTRLVLLEKTSVSREMMVEREEKLLDRFEALIVRYQKQAADDQKHSLKVFGHDLAEQIKDSEKRIHRERDEIDAEREEARRLAEAARVPIQSVSPLRAWIAAHWMWVGGMVLLIMVLRPDLATAVVRLVL